MNFNQAVEVMKSGGAVALPSWLASEFLFISGGRNIGSANLWSEAAKKVFQDASDINVNEYFCLADAEDFSITPGWTPIAPELVSEEWLEVGLSNLRELANRAYNDKYKTTPTEGEEMSNETSLKWFGETQRTLLKDDLEKAWKNVWTDSDGRLTELSMDMIKRSKDLHQETLDSLTNPDYDDLYHVVPSLLESAPKVKPCHENLEDLKSAITKHLMKLEYVVNGYVKPSVGNIVTKVDNVTFVTVDALDLKKSDINDFIALARDMKNWMIYQFGIVNKPQSILKSNARNKTHVIFNNLIDLSKPEEANAERKTNISN